MANYFEEKYKNPEPTNYFEEKYREAPEPTPEPEAVAAPEAEEPRETTWGEFGTGLALDLGIGTMRATKSIPDLASFVLPDAWTDPWSEFFERGIDSAQAVKPEAYKAEGERGFINYETGEWQMPSAEAWLGTGIQSLPMVPFFLAGGGGTANALRATKTFAQAGKGAELFGYGLTNAAMVAPDQWRQTYQDALDKGMSEEDARYRADWAASTTAALTQVTGTTGGAVAQKLGAESSNIIAAIMKGFMGEAPFEGFEEGGQNIISDIALDKPIDWLAAKDVAALAGTSGGAPGSGVAAIEHMGKPRQVTANTPPAPPEPLDLREELHDRIDQGREENETVAPPDEVQNTLETIVRDAIEGPELTLEPDQAPPIQPEIPLTPQVVVDPVQEARDRINAQNTAPVRAENEVQQEEAPLPERTEPTISEQIDQARQAEESDVANFEEVPLPKKPPDLLEQLSNERIRIDREAFRGDLSEDQNIRVGNKWLYEGKDSGFKGMGPDELVTWMVENGYMPEPDPNTPTKQTTNDAINILNSAIQGERVQSINDDQAWADYDEAVRYNDEIARAQSENEWLKQEKIEEEEKEDALAALRFADENAEISDEEWAEKLEQQAADLESTLQEAANVDEGTVQRVGKQSESVSEKTELIPEATTTEKRKAEQKRRDSERNGLGEDVVTPDQGEGELFAGNEPGVRPEQTDAFEKTKPTLSDKAEAAKARLKAKRHGTFNEAIDPQDFADLVIIATDYVHKGAKTFKAYSDVMVKEFGDWVKPHLTDIWEELNKEVVEFDDSPINQPKPDATPSRVSRRETSTKNAVMQGDRGGPILAEAREENPETVDRAIADINANPDLPKEIINRLLNDPEPSISLRDEAVLFIHKVDLRIKMRKVARTASNEKLSDDQRNKAGEEYGKLLVEHEHLDMATHRSGAVWGRFGQLRSRMMLEDYSFDAQQIKAKVALGRPLSKTEKNKLEELTDKVADLIEKNQELTEKLDAERDKVASESIMAGLAKDYKGKPGKKKAATLKKRGDELIKEGRATLESMFLGVSANPMLNPEAYLALAKIGSGLILKGISVPAKWIDAMRAEVGEKIFGHIEGDMDELFTESMRLSEDERIERGETAVDDLKIAAEALSEADQDLDHRTVYNLARAFVLQGVTEEGAVMSAVHEALAPYFEGLTEREVRRIFVEYGQAREPNPDADKKALRELRTLIRNQEHIDRMMEGLDPLRTGQQRDKATQKVRDKIKQVNILLKRRARDNPDPSKEKLASIDEQRIRRLKNRIEDLKKQIATGLKPKKGEPVPDSAEVTRLKKKVKVLQDRWNEIERAKNPPKTEAQKQIDNLGRIRDRLDEQLRLGVPQVKNRLKKFRPLTQEAADMQAEIEAMRELVKEIKKARKPKVDKQAAADARRIKQLEAAIDEYDRRIKDGDFSALVDNAKRGSNPNPRIKALQDLRNQRRKVYQAAKKAANQPILSPEEKYNKQRTTQLKRELKEVQRRIKEKDYAPKKRKVPPKLTEENKKLTEELMNAKIKLHEQVMDWERSQLDPVGMARDYVSQGISLTRAMITSVDLSAMLRQGGFLFLSNPRMAIKAFVPMIKALKNEENARAVNEEILSRPNADLYKKAGLFLAEQDSMHPTKMEEVYMGRWQRQVPLVAASGRAYVTFLNKLRADAFDASVDAFGKGHLGGRVGGGSGLTMEELKALARFINITTGRANLGRTNLSDILFAPRWMVSRFQTVIGSPLRHQRDYKGKIINPISPRMRRHIAWQYARFLLGFTTLYGLAALAFGDDDQEEPFLELDPRSTDFGKLRIGNTRLDMMAGLAQPIVFMSRIFSGTKVNSKGEVVNIVSSEDNPVPFGGDEGRDILWRFLQSKAAPGVSTFMNSISGTNVVGDTYAERAAFMRDVLGVPAEIAESKLVVEAMSLATPLSIRDFYDALQEHGLPQAAALQVLATLGVSMNTYDTNARKKKKSKGMAEMPEMPDMPDIPDMPDMP